jgi:flagellar motor switch/type III secretory pathway protein FliN
MFSNDDIIITPCARVSRQGFNFMQLVLDTDEIIEKIKQLENVKSRSKSVAKDRIKSANIASVQFKSQLYGVKQKGQNDFQLYFKENKSYIYDRIDIHFNSDCIQSFKLYNKGKMIEAIGLNETNNNYTKIFLDEEITFENINLSSSSKINGIEFTLKKKLKTVLRQVGENNGTFNHNAPTSPGQAVIGFYGSFKENCLNTFGLIYESISTSFVQEPIIRSSRSKISNFNNRSNSASKRSILTNNVNIKESNKTQLNKKIQNNNFEQLVLDTDEKKQSENAKLRSISVNGAKKARVKSSNVASDQFKSQFNKSESNNNTQLNKKIQNNNQIMIKIYFESGQQCGLHALNNALQKNSLTQCNKEMAWQDIIIHLLELNIKVININVKDLLDKIIIEKPIGVYLVFDIRKNHMYALRKFRLKGNIWLLDSLNDEPIKANAYFEVIRN